MPELICFRLLDVESPAVNLVDAVCQVNAGQAGSSVHVVAAESFAQVPNAPFAYWVEEKVRRLFKELPPFESEGRTARVGLQTGDDFRFVRCWWEVQVRDGKSANRDWFPLAKGGPYAPYYSDLHLCVKWHNDGYEISKSSGSYIRNSDFYTLAGITWTHRTTSKLAFRVLPSGAVFGGKGPGIFCENVNLLLPLLSLLNSRSFIGLVSIALAAADSAARSYDTGIINRTPIPHGFPDKDLEDFKNAAERAWRLAFALDCSLETSHRFVVPWPRGILGSDLACTCAEFLDAKSSISSLDAVQDEINPVVAKLYGADVVLESADALQAEGDEDDDGPDSSNGFSPHLFSYLVGVVFGRWAVPDNPDELRKPPADPFAPLPAQAPGAAPAGLAKLYFVEEEGAESSILDGCREALRRATGLADITTYEQDLASRLEVTSLRDYLNRPASFFADHLAAYSKSRRKAPIYWPLSTRSGDFVIWVYYPKLDTDSLPRLITEVLDPRLRRLNEELAALAADGKASARKAKLEALRLELAEMRQDFQDLIARGYKPDLNDGVLITACPLAKYFRLPKFRRDLEDCWKKLSRGDFDWARLAMSMWPERVLEACRRDRSIAIAHGKEGLCPAEPPKAKKGRKKAE